MVALTGVEPACRELWPVPLMERDAVPCAGVKRNLHSSAPLRFHRHMRVALEYRAGIDAHSALLVRVRAPRFHWPDIVRLPTVPRRRESLLERSPPSSAASSRPSSSPPPSVESLPRLSLQRSSSQQPSLPQLPSPPPPSVESLPRLSLQRPSSQQASLPQLPSPPSLR